MLDIFKRPITIIIVIVAVIIAMVWSYISKVIQQKQVTATDTGSVSTAIDLTTADAADFNEILRNELASATAKAIESDPQNKLAVIEIELPSLLINSGETRYIFTSENNKTENWLITFNQQSNSFLRAKVPKDDYMGDLPAMNTALWKFNYVTAIQITEDDGGLAWRNTNGLSGVTLRLIHNGQNNWLVWEVEYKSGEAIFSKMIDANSGKVITE